MLRKLLTTMFGQIGKNRKYQKFVIISRSRTGSNLLCDLLNSHPKIEANRELFHNTNAHSCREIWESLFVKKYWNIKYVGFKIFYYHPLKSVDKEVWDFIENDKTIKIIHLTRKNMLRTIISREIAIQTNVWIDQGGGNADPISLLDKRFEINIDLCLKKIEETKTWEKQTSTIFLAHPVIELTYEELTADTQKAMNRIYSFFNLTYYPATSDVRRQNPETIKNLIINYDELATVLLNEGYSDFLEENYS